MSQERPFALHLTWTTYGTWLPGDTRGYVSNTLGEAGKWTARSNRTGTEYAADDPHTEAYANAARKHETVWLNAAQAFLVAQSIVAAAGVRRWRIVRGAIMSNHLHLLMQDCPHNGPEVRRVLKGNSQSALSSAHGSSRRWWTAGGSDRYKNDDSAIETAIEYIRNQAGILVAIEENEILM